MTLAELQEYILSHYESDIDHPIEKDPTVIVFRRLDNKKWFAALKNIKCRNVDVDRDGRIDILNVRLEPRTVAKLRTREGFRPAWRMNQNAWVTILLDGSVADDEVFGYLDASFDNAGGKAKKR